MSAASENAARLVRLSTLFVETYRATLMRGGAPVTVRIYGPEVRGAYPEDEHWYAEIADPRFIGGEWHDGYPRRVLSVEAAWYAVSGRLGPIVRWELVPRQLP